MTGIITGIIVGIILFFLQNKKVKNDEQQIARLEFNKILTTLKFKMLKSHLFLFNTKSVDCLNSNIQESIIFLMEQPIHYLEDKLNDTYNTEFETIKDAINSYQDFMPIADALDKYVAKELLAKGPYDALSSLENDSGIIFALINNEQIKNRFYFNDEKLSFLSTITDTEEIVFLTRNYESYRTEFIDKILLTLGEKIIQRQEKTI